MTVSDSTFGIAKQVTPDKRGRLLGVSPRTLVPKLNTISLFKQNSKKLYVFKMHICQQRQTGYALDQKKIGFE